MMIYCKCGWWGIGSMEHPCPQCGGYYLMEDKHERETCKGVTKKRRIQIETLEKSISKKCIQHRETRKAHSGEYGNSVSTMVQRATKLVQES